MTPSSSTRPLRSRDRKPGHELTDQLVRSRWLVWLGWLGFAGLFLGGLLACTPADDGGQDSTASASLSINSVLITNARIFDGLGTPPTMGALRVRGSRILELGDLEPWNGETVIDADGAALAPGFVDTHSHHDGGLSERPDAIAAVSQGITTVIVGQDGGSHWPLAELFEELERSPVAVNLASYSGHNTLRRRVLGADFRRAATDAEIAEMTALLEKDLSAGALGLSTGLEYDPGIYSTTGEVLALAKVAADSGGRYISHIRSEDRAFWPAIDELLEIGRTAELPVQISHLKLAMSSLQGRASELIARLEQARADGIDVTADIYPYTYWQSTLEVLFPQRDFDSLSSARFAVTELSTPEGMLVADFLPRPEYAGKTLAEIASLREQEPAQALIDLIAMAGEYSSRLAPEEDGNRVESVIATSMIDADIESFLRWEHTNLCSDGSLAGAHPRSFGSFPRFLGRYVRERAVLTLEEAIRRSTSLATAHVGLADRGRLEPGMPADLVLFDPDTVIDNATTNDPHALSTGIRRVWVNGVEVWREGAPTGRRPGQVLRRGLGAERDEAEEAGSG